LKIEEVKVELQNFLSKKYIKPKVVVMPDFFFDRIINLDYDLASFSTKLKKITSQKGGSLDGISQMDIKGGNAINTATSLAVLGAKVTPIVCTNNQGIKIIRSTSKKCEMDLSHIKKGKKASITTALELNNKNQKINIMLRDLGDLSNFQASDLNYKDKFLIENADYVCLFNWAGTRNHGTELAQEVFSRVKKRGKGKTYYDTADPNSNIKKIPELVKMVLTSEFIDILSLNENEVITYASFIDKQIQKKKQTKINEKLSLDAARVLANKLNSRIDLHTPSFSATLTKKKEVCVRTFRIKPLRATGAGDSWNAGNIIGDANQLTDESRIILANAVSACYLSDPKGQYPTKKTLANFIEKEVTNNLLLNSKHTPIF
jgi:sugar/nucleoside kinase (ribokinase family)